MHIHFNVPLIKKIRKQLDMSQRDLAKAAGMHYNTINNIESHDACTLDLAERLARYFKCDPMQLLLSSPNNNQPLTNYALVEGLK